MNREERKAQAAKTFDAICNHMIFHAHMDEIDAQRNAMILMQTLKEIDESKTFSEQAIDSTREENNLDDPHFHGPGFVKPLDQKRLTKHMFAVFHCMLEARDPHTGLPGWVTNEYISRITGIPEGSASACYRAFRRKEWGAHTVLRHRVAKGGLYQYKLIPNKESLTYKDYEKRYLPLKA